MYKKLLCATLASLSLAGCASINPELKQQLAQSLAESFISALGEVRYPTSNDSQSADQNNGTPVDFTDFINCHVVEVQQCSKKIELEYYENSDMDKALLRAMTPAQRASVRSVNENDEPEKYGDIGIGRYELSIKLKNAVAFGVPIESLEFLSDYEWGSSTVTFVNADDLAKVSRHFSISDPRFDQLNSVLAVDYHKRFCNVSGENCDYKKIPARSLYDYKGRRLPDLDSVADGCYWGVVFNVHERSVSSQGGC